jgi:hypothetical protein
MELLAPEVAEISTPLAAHDDAATIHRGDPRATAAKAELLAMRPGESVPGEASPTMPAPAPADELAKAQRRVAELERKVGQQQIELDFFQQALRQLREKRPRRGAPGGTASTRSSKR